MFSNDLIEEANLFIPEGNDVYFGEKKKIVRFIFDGKTKFSEYENQCIQEFKEFFTSQFTQKNDTNCLQNFQNLSDNYLLRFILATGFRFKDTISSIQLNLAFRVDVRHINHDDEVTKFLNNGQIYCYGRDHNYRPILVMNIWKFNMKEISLDTFKKVITIFLEHVIGTMMIPGQVENWITIMDLNKMGLTSLPMGTIKQIMKFLATAYRSRLYRSYIVNSPWTVSIPWKIIKTFLEKVTVEKINIESNSYCKRMGDHINKVQLEKKYGGLAENLSDNYWPPKCGSLNYMLDSEDKSKR